MTARGVKRPRLDQVGEGLQSGNGEGSEGEVLSSLTKEWLMDLDSRLAKLNV